MIDIQLTPRKNPNKLEQNPKYYPAVVSKGETTLKELTQQIAQMSSLSRTDCVAVLTALLELLPQELLRGRIVRLGDLGSFRLTVKGEGLDQPSDFTSNAINKTQLRFNPGLEVKAQLQEAEFRLVTSSEETSTR